MSQFWRRFQQWYLDWSHGKQCECGWHSRQHIMAVLSDLYCDTELACIREYTTNGGQ